MHAISTILGLDELLEHIINNTRKGLGVESVRLYLLTDSGQYSLRQGFPVRGNVSPDRSLGDEVVRWIQRTGKIVLREERVPRPCRLSAPRRPPPFFIRTGFWGC